ncbi:MAG: DNA repair and recombination protein RadA [Candidatus Lokiarchaeota archaeon]|nr:DNA repair and recombination protein RadA [Candidatus Lokiarchaeota archaeon]MBD3340792.1 DNA repair and recombination protein RadA [Candidatus Lokiarchaeota archaeon]
MGDPYYCTQCERNHIKGKIYKNHLKYAQDLDLDDNGSEEKDENSPQEKEILEEEDEEIEEEDLEEEVEEDEIEYDEEDFEDFEDIIEDDFEEEVEDEEDEEPENLEDDDEDEGDLSIKEEIEECIQAVKSLPGVGKATLNKLVKAGFKSLESIAYTPPTIIQDECGIGEKTTIKLIKASMKKLSIGFKSAEIIWEHRKNIARISTGSHEFDDLLGGGVETGSLIEFFGEFRTGKTQVMHQLCVNVQLPQEKGGLEGNALYIDTEGTFRPERIIQMAEALDLDYNQVLKNIVFGRAYNSDHQILLIKEAAGLIKEKNIKLIVVDSLIGHFRNEYIGRGTLANRQQILNTHLHDLLRLCDIYPELAVVVTNQVAAKPDVFYGNPLRPVGGNIIAHGSTIRVYLRKGKGEQRIAKIVDAPNLPEGEAVFSITEEGIKEG